MTSPISPERIEELARLCEWDKRYTSGHVPKTLHDAASALRLQAKRIEELELKVARLEADCEAWAKLSQETTP